MNQSLNINSDEYLSKFRVFTKVQELLDLYYETYADEYNEPNLDMIMDKYNISKYSKNSLGLPQEYYKGIVEDRYPYVSDFLLTNIEDIDWVNGLYGANILYKLAGSIEAINMIPVLY